MKPIAELRSRLTELSHLFSTLAVLNWDQEVYMPEKGIEQRAATFAYLSGLMHEKFVNIDHDQLLTKLKRQLEKGELRGKDAVIVREVWRVFERERKLPKEFVEEMAGVISKAQTVWAKARQENNFKLFLPWLSKIVELKRKEAGLVGYVKSPYDALLDSYEPGATTEEVSRVLNDLKDFLVPFLKELRQVKKASHKKRTHGTFPLERQKLFNEFVAKTIGFDMQAGRLDASAHPFTTNFHPQDVRITTRYRENDLLYSLGSTIHEAGHAMYEQGLPIEYFGTPLAEAVSLGVHESQSRFWENLIGKSKSFWKYMYPKLTKEFPQPFKKISLDDFYAILNEVEPSFIRTEADEVTYNLHIIMRFELEREIIEGSIELKDLPLIWNTKMKEYLGVTPPTDTLGVLQDVHWSAGYFGYFPTYTLGNLYAAQFWSGMEKEIPGLSKEIAKGNFKVVRDWLRRHVHAHGKTYGTRKLLLRATGEDMNSQHFTNYLRKKYGALYPSIKKF